MDFVIVDSHTPATDLPSMGGPLATADWDKLAAALELSLNRDYAAAYGTPGDRWRFASPAAPPQAGEVVAMVVDTMPPGEEDALALHTWWQGAAEIVVDKAACTSLFSGPLSLLVLFDHENKEARRDRGCNLYADNPADGFSYALEPVDACESETYEVDGLSFANFLYAPFFEPDGSGILSHAQALGLPTGIVAPFATAPGGYQIRRPTAGGNVSVFGSIRPERLARKRHKSSRTRRRGVIL